MPSLWPPIRVSLADLIDRWIQDLEEEQLDRKKQEWQGPLSGVEAKRC